MVKYTAINLYINRFIFKRDSLLRKNVSGNLNQDEWDWVRLRSPTWRTKIKPFVERSRDKVWQFYLNEDCCHSLIVRWGNYFLSSERLIEKYFTPARGCPFQTSKFYKYSTHAVGLSCRNCTHENLKIEVFL